MSKRIDISADARAVIEEFFLKHNFSRYRELSRLLRKRHGVRVCKSTLHEWGQSLRDEFEAGLRLGVRRRGIVAGAGQGTPMTTRALERLAAELSEAAEAQRSVRKRLITKRRARRVKTA